MTPLQKRRVFVGNLPPNTTESEIGKKFSKFGCIKSVEIKQRPDSSTFAFLDFEVTEENLKICFESLSKKKWNGRTVKLELAKESFLNRLERERQEHVHDSKPIGECPKVVEKAELVKHKRKKKEHKDKNISSSDASSDSEEETKWKLKKFQGTKQIGPYLDSGKNEITNAPKFCFDHKKSVAMQKPGNILQRLEAFSDFWKDEQDSCKSPERNKKMQKILNGSPSQNDKTFRSDINSKRLLADKKRMKSIDEKRKTFRIQREAIKKALTSVDSDYKNKKIVFDSNDESDDDANEILGEFDEEKISNDEVEENQIRKSVLFNDSSDDEESNHFKIRSQFEGEKGHKLLQLQSRYANDKRFALDERFYESEDDFTKQDADKTESGDLDDEKKRQHEILENVLGHGIPVSEEKNKKRTTTMLRFDPSKPDHAKFEKQIVPKTKQRVVDLIPDSEPQLKDKKKKERKGMDEDGVQIPVSKEKFYLVTDTLKESLQKKERQNEFSLRELFGRKDEDSADEGNDEAYNTVTLQKGKKIVWDTNPFKYDSSDDEDGGKEQTNVPTDLEVENDTSQRNQVNFHESFFFKPNDPRLKEGLEFLSRGQATDTAQDFTSYRRELKQLIRFKVKNNLRNHRPFKKKIGGNKGKNFRKKI